MVRFASWAFGNSQALCCPTLKSKHKNIKLNNQTKKRTLPKQTAPSIPFIQPSTSHYPSSPSSSYAPSITYLFSMNFFRSGLPPAPLEELLNKWEASLQTDLTPSQTNPPSTDDSSSSQSTLLEQFLAEEDVLRDCRSENKRLIAYLTTPETIRSLADYVFQLPLTLIPSNPLSNLSRGLPRGIPAQDASNTDENDLKLSQAYVASELFSCENKVIADAILSDLDVMDAVFSVIEIPPRATLNPLVAINFSKLILSLLKVRNSATIHIMAQRDPSLINGILDHMDSAPIAELVVRMLDGPEPEQSYHAQPSKKPAFEALTLLADSDFLGGLAERFKHASSDSVSTDTDISDNGSDEEDSIAPLSREATLRRFREETMSNVTAAILGLTERVLLLPELGSEIPAPLSPYSTPAVVCRLLDAGLYASCNGKTNKDTALNDEFNGTNEERVEAFSLHNNSALFHSLSLAANLMTTEANVVRDERADTTSVTVTSARPGGIGIGRVYSGRGIRPASANNKKEEDDNDASLSSNASVEENPILKAHQQKKAGDLIVDTAELEAELAIRFPRLAKMFGDDEDIADMTRMRPLGSLRLKLAEFFVACMKKSSRETVEQITDLGVPRKLLDLFAKYQWSSMLHGVVTKSIVSAFEAADVGRPARTAWFGAGVIPWLMEAWSRNAVDEDEGTKRTRAGYMGHLIRIGTALKAYVEESADDAKADLPAEIELDSFALFAEQFLAPAHYLEATPLCGEQLDSNGSIDEGEEATDVLDMGGMSFVEHLSYDGSSKQGIVDVDEEEEIRPVEVDDLDHFGADDDDIQEVKPLIDHDIPIDLRERLKVQDTTGIVEVAEVAFSERVQKSSGSELPEQVKPFGLKPIGLKAFATLKDTSIPVEELKTSSILEDTSVPVEDLKGVIDTVDSSSEDEGSYIEFVDHQKDVEMGKLSSRLDTIRLSEPDAGASLDGIVTEIEEPGPLTPSGEQLQPLVSNIMTIPEEDPGNSSDEEYEAWEDPSRLEPTITSPIEPLTKTTKPTPSKETSSMEDPSSEMSSKEVPKESEDRVKPIA